MILNCKHMMRNDVEWIACIPGTWSVFNDLWAIVRFVRSSVVDKICPEGFLKSWSRDWLRPYILLPSLPYLILWNPSFCAGFACFKKKTLKPSLKIYLYNISCNKRCVKISFVVRKTYFKLNIKLIYHTRTIGNAKCLLITTNETREMYWVKLRGIYNSVPRIPFSILVMWAMNNCNRI